MLLDLALPDDDAWTRAFSAGLAAASEVYDVDLIGGDTTSIPPGSPRFIAISMAGATTSAGPIARSGARPGDALLVTGCPGLAGAGYLFDEPQAAALDALRHPASRVDFALDVAHRLSAAMDLSDGLASDLPRLCAVIDPDALPIHPAMRGGSVATRTLQLAAGDDYELLLAVPQTHVAWVRRRAHALDVPLHPIGQVMAAPGVHLTEGDWPAAPWQHFGGGGR
jgi:thiamine-monophosphate kinase